MGPTGQRSLVRSDTRVIVSSSAQGSSKRSLLDPASEECWTSNSLPSSIHLVFPSPISGATHIALTFQGGFVGTTATVYVATRPRASQSEISLGLMMGGRIYPEDKNKRQVFWLPYPPSTGHPSPAQAEARGNLLSAMTSQGTLGPNIVTEIPANPNGGGARAPSLLNGVNGDADHDLADITELKIEFEASSDQYGRVTVYSIEVLA